MTVYADVLFLVNFSLDYVSLYITGRLMSHPMKTGRLCASSALGACYAVCALFFDAAEPIYIAATLLVCVLMCAVAYGYCGVGTTAGAAVLLFAVGCALGGVMTAVYSLGAGYSDELTAGSGGGDVVFLVAAAAVAVVAACGRISKRRRGVRTKKVKITVGDVTAVFDALADSGNLLRDPLSGRAVMIISKKAAGKLLPSRDAAFALSGGAPGADEALQDDLRARIRLLPVSNVYGEGILRGYRPDAVFVETVTGKGKGDFKPVDCIIAVSDKEDGFGGCDAVLPAELS